MADIVYILRNGIEPYELRYSLRSLVNFPHDRVWFVGGKAKGIEPDAAMYFTQNGKTSWDRIRNSLIKACENPEISDDFWLFNDDFFIMQHTEDLPYMYHGDLQLRIAEVIEQNGKKTPYASQLRLIDNVLKAFDYQTLNYCLHVPMLMNKGRLLEVIERFQCFPMIRSLYGNYWQVGGVECDDVKVYDTKTRPQDAALLSTDDFTFAYGNVGKLIRGRFRAKSRFEC